MTSIGDNTNEYWVVLPTQYGVKRYDDGLLF